MDAEETKLTLHGLPIPGDPEGNIILKAYQTVKKDFPDLPPIHFYLLKNIPPGAGLGAGSANGASALLGLNKKFQLGLSDSQLISYALQLGSDCPFFIVNKPSFATGRGEKMEPVPLDLSGFKICVVNPSIHIATPEAFKQIKPSQPENRLNKLIRLPLTDWKHQITNDFEAPIFNVYPQVATIKNKMYEGGALFALMSGSGSTVYGIFEKNTALIPEFPGYFTRIIDVEI